MPSQANNPIQPEVIPVEFVRSEPSYLIEDEAAEALAGESVDDVVVWTDSLGRVHIDLNLIEKGRTEGHRKQLEQLAHDMVKAAGRLLLELDRN